MPQKQSDQSKTRLDGVVIGVLVGLNDNHKPLVAFPGNPKPDCVVAQTTIRFSEQDIGREVALLFENGDPLHPLIIGRIQHPEKQGLEKTPMTADLDGERIEFSAKKEIVLKCGKASITLTRTGKIILRGNYLLSRSSGVNRVKGGSVQIN
ncbi:MAG: hypothetical protein KZQ76_07590 [Candidatus Thiodiazotropha sp. (ex Epidulcina cf. delphinae)]|nr:hypothetical protein [Candidatus Thiodiazotropha sp. (ex Epidulcina cf. delphinae)]